MHTLNYFEGNSSSTTRKVKSLPTLIWILGLAVLLILAACAPATLNRPIDLKGKIIRVGGEVYAPMFLSNNGTYSGFDVDVLTAICNLINCKLRYQQLPFDNLLSGVIAGKINLAISGITITNQREKTVDFTKPYLILNPGTPEEDRLGFALASGSDLRSALNTGLDLIRSNGTYDAIYRKWFPSQ